MPYKYIKTKRLSKPVIMRHYSKLFRFYVKKQINAIYIKLIYNITDKKKYKIIRKAWAAKIGGRVHG